MKTNKDIKFPYYSGNIRLTKVIGHVDLHNFIMSHENPKLGTIDIINKIKEANAIGDKKLKRELKHNLYSFTPSVYIPLNYKRRYENVGYYTGLMQLDFDGINDNNLAEELKDYIFEQREIITCYSSPSGGVKALMNIKIPKNKEQYKAIFKAVKQKYDETNFFDEATKNAMLPLFLSVDYNIKYRDVSKCITWTDEDNSKVEYKALLQKPTNPNPNFTELDFYEKKTVRIFTNKVNEITDNGHPQLRSACLILGSRCAAGYMHVIDAEVLAENCILGNTYFHKGIKGYVDTAKWAINEGFKTPLYYD